MCAWGGGGTHAEWEAHGWLVTCGAGVKKWRNPSRHLPLLFTVVEEHPHASSPPSPDLPLPPSPQDAHAHTHAPELLQIGRACVVDMTRQEEQCATSGMQVAVDARGCVCAMTKKYSQAIDPGILMVGGWAGGWVGRVD